jgi:alkanesulfonate monooxygenase SsuD/methylene tetrahydromethanopterin reductase-like flavin-dependent oxidoreductase (luciferase family)
MSRRKVQFGVKPTVAIANPQQTIQEIRQADRDGLDLFAITDHPYFADRLEAYATVGYGLGATQNITAVTDVTNLPFRPAPLLSRTITSLSALSGGRIVLGLGAGGYLGRIADFGAPRLTPGQAVAAFEESFAVLRALAGCGPAVSITGTHYSISESQPAPVDFPPIWTGSVGPKSLAITGRLADGWFPGGSSDWRSALYRDGRAIIDEAALAAGRSPSDIATIYNLRGTLTSDDVASTRDEDGRWQSGSVRQWVDELTSAVLEHGAAGFIYFEPAPDDFSRWSHEIVPAVRAAIASA